MERKRRAKNGAVASTTRCAGSNHATYTIPPASSDSTERKRTNAFILCAARFTARAML